MFMYTTIALISCATLALTSSVTKTETDGASRDNQNVFPAESLHIDNGHNSSTVVSPATSDKRPKNESRSVVMSEGGPIHRPENVESSPYLVDLAPAATSGEATPVDVSAADAKAKLPKTRNASVVARKGALPSSKITARKGVGPEATSSRESTTEGVDEAVAHLPSARKNNETGTLHPQLQKANNGSVQSTTVNGTSIRPSTVEHTQVVSSNDTSSDASVARNFTQNANVTARTETSAPTVATEIVGNTTGSGVTAKKFKPKPTVTIGETDIDKPIPASPTKTPPLGMPRKIDYIVPVIITIIALPLLGGATFLLYRRGRDCWDKRHYRRMDFLIDGMYNDYSWK